MTVLFSSHQTTLAGLKNLVANIAKELYTEAIRNNLLVSGPQYWIYHGMDGKPDTVFTLEIALPVQGQLASSKFATKELPPFKAVTTLHERAWDQMGLTYGQLMQHVFMNNLKLTNECRELYLNVDFDNPDNNRTEIQVGVA